MSEFQEWLLPPGARTIDNDRGASTIPLLPRVKMRRRGAEERFPGPGGFQETRLQCNTMVQFSCRLGGQ